MGAAAARVPAEQAVLAAVAAIISRRPWKRRGAPMFEALVLILAVFGAGFAAGFGLRAWLSHRRREKMRRLRGFGEPAPGGA